MESYFIVSDGNTKQIVRGYRREVETLCRMWNVEDGYGDSTGRAGDHENGWIILGESDLAAHGITG